MEERLIRIVLAGIVLFLAILVVTWCYRRLRGSDLDWTGIVFAAGFVVMAFWLRHVTGIG